MGLTCNQGQKQSIEKDAAAVEKKMSPYLHHLFQENQSHSTHQHILPNYKEMKQ